MLPTTKTSAKCSNACTYCRLKKIKCDGGPRCSNCQSHNEQCIFPPPQRRNRNSLREENKLLIERLTRMEAILRNPTTPHALISLASPEQRSPEALQKSPVEDSQQSIVKKHSPKDVQQTDNARPCQTPHETGNNEQHAPYESISNDNIDFPVSDILTYPDSISSNAAIHGSIDETISYDEAHKIDAEKNQNMFSNEHHGPASFLSICSKPGLKWVTERTGATDFTEYARTLTSEISRRLKLQVNRVRERAPELDSQTAWRYCNTYFEESGEPVASVVNRPAFESRLHAHFVEGHALDEDPAWYALRNTVYASGCRIELSKAGNGTTFAEAQSHAWRHFENALSVHTELLYSQTGILAVEALTAMCYYVEGLGSPALEYMLCSSATRLAQSKGLHLQPLETWDLSEDDIINRNWLWWTIYCHEKHISYRSGRPSAIDDDDISCQIPMTKTPGSSINVGFFSACVRHAQIQSAICKSLATVKAYKQTPRELVKTVVEMDRMLDVWRKSLPSYLQPSTTIKYSSIPQGIQITHVLYIYYAYYGSLLAIHTIFTYPWTSAIISTDNSSAFRDQVSLSTNAVVEASRNIILITKHIEIDASSPVWLAFYYPFVGLINLFVYILKYPNLPTAHSDVALMDVIAGHFGRVEFITAAELAFPFIREITSLANKMVKKARIRLPAEPVAETTTQNSSYLMDEPMSSFGFGPSNDFANMDMTGFDLDDWSMLSQMSPMGMDSMTM